MMSIKWALVLLASIGAAANAVALDAPPSSNAGVRYLTSGDGFTDYWPCFSPDGKTVLFSRKQRDVPQWDLWAVTAAGGGLKRFDTAPLPVSATRANWSKDNGLIAFTGTDTTGKNGVWVIGADATNAREVAHAGSSSSSFYPSWYPGGDELAVMNGKDLSIQRIDLRRSSLVTLTDPGQILTGMPSVSPDGHWIAFAGQLNHGQRYDQTKNTIWLLDLADNSHRTLENQPGQGRAPTWSPDGEWLAFESNRGDFSGAYAVYIERRDGTALRRVTDFDLNGTHPVWSPDAKALVFAAANPTGDGTTRIAIVNLQL